MDGAVLPPLQSGPDLLGPHGFHLPGDTGHQYGAVPLGVFKPGAGCRAVVVDDLVTVDRDHSLLAVVGSWGAIGAGEECHDLLPLILIKAERIPEGFGHCFFGEVILRRAKTAGKHQQVTAGTRLIDQFPQPLGIVPDHMLMQNTDSQFCQFPAEVLRIGVDNVPQQQLRSHANDFCRHSKSSSPIRMAIFSTCSAASVSSAASSGIASSAARISARVGLVLGWGGVKMVQQSS